MSCSESAAGRRLAAGRYFFDEISVGDHLETGSADVTAELIRQYAELSGDRYALHLDDEAANDLGFPGLIAHGILILGLADGLKFQSPVQMDGIASLGWDIDFTSPVFAGDSVSVQITVTDKRVTSRKNRGIATFEFVVRNQRGEVVQRGTNKLMMCRKVADQPADGDGN